MKEIAAFIDMAIKARSDETALEKIKAGVRELCSRFPFYRELVKQGS
ncbi:MAG: hypothetical protein HY886_10830 [Deltaproteobacteria bacterium]|nr:hypothetical protein [Deltaproteobacteria bacterium]